MNWRLRLLSVVSPLMLAGCVSPIKIEEQTPDLGYLPTGKVIVSVIDKRDRVAQGKDPNYIGRAHGAFGIPSDMEVYPWLSREKVDKNMTLAEFLQHRLTAGLAESTWNATEHSFSSVPSAEEIQSVGETSPFDRLVVLVLKEWFVSINLNWVTAFSFDSNVDVVVANASGEEILRKTIEDKDIIDEQATESPQNNLLRAFRDQLKQILEDADIQRSLAQ